MSTNVELVYEHTGKRHDPKCPFVIEYGYAAPSVCTCLHIVMTLYKWLLPDRTTTYQGTPWPVRARAWTPTETPAMCKSGWHLATVAGVAAHAQVGAVLWEAEGRGESVEQPDKFAFASARIIRPIGTLDRQTAARWAADCAERVLCGPSAAGHAGCVECIAAARAWADDPSEANRERCDRAAAAACYAAAAAANYAAAAADYATYATYAAANYAAAAYAAAAAANTAAYAERQWQGERLLAYLGGDV